jgi:hypothetical protein
VIGGGRGARLVGSRARGAIGRVWLGGPQLRVHHGRENERRVEVGVLRVVEAEAGRKENGPVTRFDGKTYLRQV